MKRLALCFSAVLLPAVLLSALLSARAQGNAPPARPSANVSGNIVRTAMKNVDFHLTDTIIVHIVSLAGVLTPDGGSIPVFDDKNSFHLEISSARVQVGTQALSNDLNEYVFAKPDAPLKHLAVTTRGNELVLKGTLASKGGISFETDGTVAATPDGQIRVHTTRIRALHLPLKGLMDVLGLDTAKLIDTKKISGIAVDKDDLILDPQQILPPPRMHGHLASIQVESGGILLVFGETGQKDKGEALSSRCGGRNFQLFRGGTVRFGKLTMSDTDLELLDDHPADPFDFSIDHYQRQLVAGYSKMSARGGLCVHMPDFGTLPKTPATK